MMDNRTIAQRLRDHAHDLEAGRTNLYRIRAYRQAALTLMGMDRSAADIVTQDGERGLASLPGIGRHLAYTIGELIRTGEFRVWEQRGVGGKMNLEKGCHATTAGGQSPP